MNGKSVKRRAKAQLRAVRAELRRHENGEWRDRQAWKPILAAAAGLVAAGSLALAVRQSLSQGIQNPVLLQSSESWRVAFECLGYAPALLLGSIGLFAAWNSWENGKANAAMKAKHAPGAFEPWQNRWDELKAKEGAAMEAVKIAPLSLNWIGRVLCPSSEAISGATQEKTGTRRL
jgi:hypothetical protein